MKDGPDIAAIAALIGDPARANMLTALMSGRALTANELASEAGVTASTASAHIAKMINGGLLTQRKQGRHRYHTLAHDSVGAALESLMGLAAAQGHLRTRAGPRDPALRRARVCYDHLAGELGVAMFDSLRATGRLSGNEENVVLTEAGRSFAIEFGLDIGGLEAARRPLCRTCLDWSMRRTHLAGGLGAGLLTRIYELGWAKRSDGARIVSFTATGEKAFAAAFPH